MVHAALRYRLGRSKDDGVIYWQIDRMGQVHDGKLMWYGPDCHRLKNRHATWVMYLLKQHYAIPQEAFQPTHIFFGSHLLSNKGQISKCQVLPSPNIPHDRVFRGCPNFGISFDSCLAKQDKQIDMRCCSSKASSWTSQAAKPSASNDYEIRTSGPGDRTWGEGSNLTSTVAIVEAEKSAVILSELYPQCLWLAAGGLGEVQPYKFLPLRNYKVILFPDTDLEGRAFTKWYDAAQTVMKSFFWPKDNPIRVSPILERHATPDQKRRKIDLVDYIVESQNQ
jgi:hypothetical protein